MKMQSTIFLAILLVACTRVERDGADMPKRDIKDVLTAHSAEIMAIPGVTGIFLSELDDKTPCILIMVLKESDELDRKIPDSLEGHPVKIVESGEFQPMDADTQSSPR